MSRVLLAWELGGNYGHVSALRGMAHQDYPFGLLVERLQPARVAGEHPLFQTLFTFQKARRSAGLLDLWAHDDVDAEIEWGGWRVSTFPVHQSGGGDELPLALEVAELGSDIRCDFEFDPKRFGRAAVERMARHYVQLLAACCDDPDRDPSSRQYSRPRRTRRPSKYSGSRPTPAPMCSASGSPCTICWRHVCRGNARGVPPPVSSR